jgi:hypothetical protein
VATRHREAWEGGVRPAAGPERGSAGSSTARAGERRECGGARYGKWPVGWLGKIRKKEKEMGPAQGNSATF